MASSGLEMNIFKLIVYNNYYAKIWPLIITFLPINQDNYTTCASWNNIYMYYKSKLMGSSKFYNIQQLTDNKLTTWFVYPDLWVMGGCKYEF